MRRKLRFSENQKSELERVRDLLREDGVMEVDVDVDMNLCLLSFTSNRLRELFQRYGTVLMCDATYECNKGGYHLWHAVVVDCNGKGRSYFTPSCVMRRQSATVPSSTASGG
jgi:hypothetical protein